MTLQNKINCDIRRDKKWVFLKARTCTCLTCMQDRLHFPRPHGNPRLQHAALFDISSDSDQGYRPVEQALMSSGSSPRSPTTSWSTRRGERFVNSLDNSGGFECNEYANRPQESRTELCAIAILSVTEIRAKMAAHNLACAIAAHLHAEVAKARSRGTERGNEDADSLEGIFLFGIGLNWISGISVHHSGIQHPAFAYCQRNRASRGKQNSLQTPQC